MADGKGKDDNGKLLYCSFCGKNQNEVRKLIAGPSVYICDECVDLRNDIIREEVLEADLIIHIRNIAHSDTETQKNDVEGVLEKLGVKEDLLHSLIEVRNKVDLLHEADLEKWVNKSERDGSVLVSAISSIGIDVLLRIIEKEISKTQKTIEIKIDLNDSKAIAWLYNRGNVLSRKNDKDIACFRVSLDKADINRFSKEFCFRSEIKNS